MEIISGPGKLVDDLRDTNLVIGSEKSESTKPKMCVVGHFNPWPGFLDEFIIIWNHIILWELYFINLHYNFGDDPKTHVFRWENLVDHLDQASHVYFWPPFLSCHWARWAIELSGPQLGTTQKIAPSEKNLAEDTSPWQSWDLFKGYHGI